MENQKEGKMQRVTVIGLFAISILLIPTVSAATIDLDLRTDKHIYGTGKNISVSGSLYDTESRIYLDGATVKVSLNGNTFSFETAEDGTYGGIIPAPSSAGNYEIEAHYTDDSGKLWKSIIGIKVSAIEVDDIRVRPNRVNYYPGEAMNIVIKPIIKKSGTSMGVQGVAIEGAIRNPDNTIYSEFSGETDASGALVIHTTAPDQMGKYTVEVNDFTSQKDFNVVEYEVVLNILDGSGQTKKSIFSSGQDAIAEVKISSNGTVPGEGAYSFISSISYANGTVIQNIPEMSLNQSNSYVGQYRFSIDSTYSSGSYLVGGTVEREGGTKAAVSAPFEVRTWSLEVEKASGFEFGYTAFPNKEVSFKITVKDRTTGAAISTLDESNFSIQLKTKAGTLLGSYSTAYNSSLGYYPVNLTLPSLVGYYTLAVQVSYSGDTQRVERTIKVTDTVAYGKPTDEQGQYKEIFGSAEYVYILLEAKNSTSTKKITDMELLRIVNEKGEAVSFQEANWSSDDSSIFEWRGNVSVNISGILSAMLKFDNPKSGGLYRVEILANDGTAIARTQFFIDPYKVRVYPYKAPKEEGDDPRYQFDTKDGIVFSINVLQAKHTSGSAVKGSEKGFYGPEPGGVGGGGGGGSSTGEEVANATIRVKEIMNDRSFEEMPLSNLNITYSGVTDANGQAEVTLVPASGSWEGGWYHVTFEITGPDGITTDKGHGGFEARAFFLFADSNWMVQPQENVTFTIYMFDAGSDFWWKSGKGLSGTVSVEKILYHGGHGEWLWPPVEYDYPLDDPSNNLKSISVQDGDATFILTAPSGGWGTGGYSLILKGTTADGETDYGEGWFEVRRWDAWASPVDESDFEWRESFGLEEDITLYVNIFNAGSWEVGESLGGNVTIGIKEITDYSSWPSQTLDSSEYKVYPVTVNESGERENLNSDYILTIEPAGVWKPGHYGVVLDVNGSETGYGWFETIAFYSEAFMVDQNGDRIYSATEGPLYFNITTSKDSTKKTPVNTEIKEISIGTWDRETWEYIEYSYPEDLTIDTTSVPGAATIQVSKTGSWPSGWYDGEIVLEDSDGSISTAWVWFDIRPFWISSRVSSREVSAKANVTLNLKILDPATYNSKPGNYSIIKIVDGHKYNEEELDYSPVNFTLNETAKEVAITITPPGGTWTSGYHSLITYIEDESGNTDHDWASFEVVPFKVTVENYKKFYKSAEDLILNVTVTDPATGLPTKANVSSVFEYGWYSNSEHDFAPSEIEGNENLTISAPEGGWEEGYHDLMIFFTDGSTVIERWAWFEVRSYFADMDMVDENGDYVRGFTPSQNVNLQLWVYMPESEWRDLANVTVTGVKYSKEYQENYVDTDWEVLNSTANEINGTGIIRLNHEGDWELGEYQVKVTISGDDGTATIRGYFRITDDVTPPQVTINSPIGTINSSSIMLNVSTSEEAECYYYIHSLYTPGATSEDYSTDGSLGTTEKKTHLSEVILYGGDYHFHVDCHDPSWNYGNNLTSFSPNGYQIEIRFSTNDLDDDGDILDNNFYDADTGTTLGDVLTQSNESYIRGINGSLIFDGNADGDLKDVGSGDDYSVYNGAFVVSTGVSNADVRFVQWYNMTNLKGTVISIKGTDYLVTDSSLGNQDVDVGPAITKYINQTSVLDLDNVVYLTGTIGLTVVNGALKIIDGTEVNGSTDVSGGSDRDDISDAVHSASDALDAYKVFITAMNTTAGGAIQFGVAESDQVQIISNDQTNFFGYAKVYINRGFANGFGINRAVFMDDNIIIPRDDSVDLPDTYFEVKYSDDKELSLMRKKSVRVDDGVTINNSNPIYDPIIDDETGEVKFDLMANDVKMRYVVDDLDDDGDILDNNFYDIDNGTVFGDVLTQSNESYIRAINGSLIFDGNGDGDLKDLDTGDDYTLYNGIYPLKMTSYTDVQLVYYLDNLTNLTGTIQKIKGINYLITDSSTADDTIELGPSIKKFIDNVSILDVDNAVTLTGMIKLTVVNDQLYIIDGTEVQGPVDLSGHLTRDDISDEVHAVSDPLNEYKIFMTGLGVGYYEIAVTESGQIQELTDDQSGALGYNEVYIDRDFANGFGINRVIFQSKIFFVLKDSLRDYIADVPDTYYEIQYSDDLEIDLKRANSVTVASGSRLKNTNSQYYKIVDDSTGVITVLAVPKG